MNDYQEIQRIEDDLFSLIEAIEDASTVNQRINQREGLKNWLRTTITKVYQAGRGSILTELVHEEKKFFDGFAHPKDCELCHLPDRPLNSERD